MDAPAISVVLAVKDETLNLQNAVTDLLAQTFTDFELIILDDASEEAETVEIIKSFEDSRIRKIYFEEHQGLAKIKNAGMKLARGKYIAMADADDRYPPQKLELQFNFLEKHPQIAFTGTAFHLLGKKYGWHLYQQHKLISAQFLLNNPFIHPSVMFIAKLREMFQYNSEFDYAEDYDLFYRISEQYQTVNLPQVLIYYNTTPKTGIKKVLSEKQTDYARAIRENILKSKGIFFSASEMEDYHWFAELKEGLQTGRILALQNHIKQSVKGNGIKEITRILNAQLVLYVNKYRLKMSRYFYLNCLWNSAFDLRTKFRLLRRP